MYEGKYLMYKIIAASLIILFFSNQVLADSYRQKFASKDNSCQILYQGAPDHGDGIFYDISSGKRKEILKEYVRVGPMINWIDNSLAELFFSEGSPAYHSEYYDCKSHRLSPSYSMVIAVEPKSKLIAAMDIEGVSFFKNFDEKPFYKAKTPDIDFVEYFNCDSDAEFEKLNVLRIKMKCGKEKAVDKTIQIPD